MRRADQLIDAKLNEGTSPLSVVQLTKFLQKRFGPDIEAWQDTQQVVLDGALVYNWFATGTGVYRPRQLTYDQWYQLVQQAIDTKGRSIG